MESYRCNILRLFPYTVYLPPDPSKLLCVSTVYSFLLRNSISWFACITVSSTIHPLKDILVGSCFWALWTKVLWTSVYRFSCEHKFPFLWHKCPSGIVGRMVSACLVLWEVAPLFSREVLLLCIPSRGVGVSDPHPDHSEAVLLFLGWSLDRGDSLLRLANFTGS